MLSDATRLLSQFHLYLVVLIICLLVQNVRGSAFREWFIPVFPRICNENEISQGVGKGDTPVIHVLHAPKRVYDTNAHVRPNSFPRML